MFDILWLKSIDETPRLKQSTDYTDLFLCNLWTYNRRMPIYEYECKKCKAHVEAFQKLNDKPLTRCRKCGGKLERQISAPAIQFKGSGWYVTDYAGKTTKSEKSESESVSDSKSDKSDKSEKKTKESSPAKKTSDKPSSSKA